MSNWSRAQLKERAKGVLRQNYWIAFVVTLILVIALSIGNYVSSSGNNNYSYSNYDYDITYDIDEDFEINNFADLRQFYKNINFPYKNIFTGVAITAMTLTLLLSIAINAFLYNPLAVGCYKFFSTSAESPHKNMDPVGIAFKKGNYWGIVGGMFLKKLYTFLWTLLLIIPGIIKAYAYRMVPYILADNPQMGANEAITLSRKMMNGEKWKTFVLDLSFIGWYLLGLLTCCIGCLFVHPYYFSTNAQLYLVLRDKAINNGYCTPEMLNLSAN